MLIIKVRVSTYLDVPLVNVSLSTIVGILSNLFIIFSTFLQFCPTNLYFCPTFPKFVLIMFNLSTFSVIQLWYYTIIRLQTPDRPRDGVPSMCICVEMEKVVGSIHLVSLER